jgi:hypothetical protein
LMIQVHWGESARPFDLPALGYTLFSFLAGFSVGPSLRDLHSLPTRTAMLEVLPWLLGVGLPAAYLTTLGYLDRTTRSSWRLLAALVAVPIGLCWILTAAMDTGYRVRYVVWGAAPLLMLLALGLVTRRGSLGRGLSLVLLVLVFGASIIHRHTQARYMNEDARGAARLITQLAAPSSPVFVVSSYMAAPVRYYLGDTRALSPLFPTPNPTATDSALAVIHQMAPSGQKFWVLYSRPFDSDPEGHLREELVKRAGLALQAALPGFEVYQGVGW